MDEILRASMHADVTEEAVDTLIFAPGVEFTVAVTHWGTVFTWNAWLTFLTVTVVAGAIADDLSDISNHFVVGFHLADVAFETVRTSSLAFSHLLFRAVASEACRAVLLTPTEVAGLHAWVEFHVAVETLMTSLSAFLVAAFSVHTVLAFVAVLIAPALFAVVVAETHVDHVLITKSHTNMASEAVDTLLMAHSSHFFGASSISFFKAWCALFTFTIVTGFVANSFGEVVHSLFHLWGLLELSKEFLISMILMAIEAVRASITTFCPLGLVAGFWVLNAGLAVFFTPAEVAGFHAWFSGHMALDTVSASIFALLHVAGIWASILIAFSA